MQAITPKLTANIAAHVGDLTPATADAYRVSSFRELVEETARLAYLNKDYLLFYRGQPRDYKNKVGASTFYPSIYRTDQLSHDEITLRFRRLERAARQLSRLFKVDRIQGHEDVARKTYVQWSVLQHYRTVDTPLLDFTHSLRVACSFAQLGGGESDEVFVYVFGLPYLTNRISIHSEQDTVIVRLLSICPPTALRPYFQDGYLAGTPDVTTEYDNKSEFDFTSRLIAKFAIPSDMTFWGKGLLGLSSEELYPPDDTMEDLCKRIQVDDTTISEAYGEEVSQLGALVAAWAGIEQRLLSTAQRREERIMSSAHAIRSLVESNLLSSAVGSRLDELRRIRNEVVHGREPVPIDRIRNATSEIRELRSVVDKLLMMGPKAKRRSL